MSENREYGDISIDVYEAAPSEVDEIMDEEGLEELNKNFGRGVTKRKLLVTKGLTLKELVNTSE